MSKKKNRLSRNPGAPGSGQMVPQGQLPRGGNRPICMFCEKAASPSLIARPGAVSIFGFFLGFVSTSGERINAGVCICEKCMFFLKNLVRGAQNLSLSATLAPPPAGEEPSEPEQDKPTEVEKPEKSEETKETEETKPPIIIKFDKDGRVDDNSEGRD